MARRTVALVFVIALFGCVDVPEGIRADFAAPTPQERSNFRQGPHGSAKPVIEVAQPTPTVAPAAAPPEPKAAEADAGAAGDTTSTTTVTGAPQ